MKDQLATAAFGLLMALFAILAVALKKRVQRSLSNGNIAQATAALRQLAASAVASTDQTYVRALKSPEKPGEWDEEAAKAAKQKALSILRVSGRAHLQSLADEDVPVQDRAVLLETLVEEAVLKLRLSCPPTLVTPEKT